MHRSHSLPGSATLAAAKSRRSRNQTLWANRPRSRFVARQHVPLRALQHRPKRLLHCCCVIAGGLGLAYARKSLVSCSSLVAWIDAISNMRSRCAGSSFPRNAVARELEIIATGFLISCAIALDRRPATASFSSRTTFSWVCCNVSKLRASSASLARRLLTSVHTRTPTKA